VRERTADLQRVKAEYDNYRKRVRRDHLAVREIAVANVLTGLLPVLDAIDAARDQGVPRDDGLERVAATLEDRLAGLGLAAFGTEGDPFDPALHEAVDHAPAPPGTPHPLCAKVHRPGYRVGSHLLRPAAVTVAQPR
jgi:molecular chaperone GrpE